MTKHLLRTTALDILVRVGEQGGFSHLLIDQAMKQKKLSIKDEALLTEIVYGTLQRKLTLEYYLKAYVDQKKTITPWVKWLLFMSFYQLQFLDKIPDHAVIHESVEIAKKRGHKGVASFVNAVLRNVQRNSFPDPSYITDDISRISIETSHPAWLVSRWIDMYGLSITKAMCSENLRHKPMSVRVQPLKMGRDTAIKVLLDQGYEVEPSLFSDQGIIINKGNVLRSTLFQENYVTIQDQSSMLVAEMLDVKQDMTVLDACSAPGGKTTHIAEKMVNKGEIVAYDLHDKKAKLVTKKAAQLDLSIITAYQADSRTLHTKHGQETFDRILIDAPCSGLGVLRGKPDIKYQKKLEDIQKLSEIQLELLESISSLLKKDGKLLYSTCTVDQSENERLIENFLNTHHQFEVDPSFFEGLPKQLQHAPGISKWGLQLFPHNFHTDGFFLTRLRRKEL